MGGEEVVEEGVGKMTEELEKSRVYWRKQKVFLVMEMHGGHVLLLHLFLLLGELSGDLDQCSPVVTKLVNWVEEGTKIGKMEKCKMGD